MSAVSEAPTSSDPYSDSHDDAFMYIRNYEDETNSHFVVAKNRPGMAVWLVKQDSRLNM